MKQVLFNDYFCGSQYCKENQKPNIHYIVTSLGYGHSWHNIILSLQATLVKLSATTRILKLFMEWFLRHQKLRTRLRIHRNSTHPKYIKLISIVNAFAFTLQAKVKRLIEN